MYCRCPLELLECKQITRIVRDLMAFAFFSIVDKPLTNLPKLSF